MLHSKQFKDFNVIILQRTVRYTMYVLQYSVVQLSVRLPAYVTVFLAKRLYFRVFCKVFSALFLVDSCFFFVLRLFVCFYNFSIVLFSSNVVLCTFPDLNSVYSTSYMLSLSLSICLSLFLFLSCNQRSSAIVFSRLRKCFCHSVASPAPRAIPT